MKNEIEIYGNPPKSLLAFARKHADKIDEVGDERGTEDGYWLYLRDGWCWDDQGLHSIHEYTANDCIRAFGSVNPCNCQDCRKVKGITPSEGVNGTVDLKAK